MAEMVTFDNGPDSFEEGLARPIVDGSRWGVVDRHGREVVPPTLTLADYNRLPVGVTGLR